MLNMNNKGLKSWIVYEWMFGIWIFGNILKVGMTGSLSLFLVQTSHCFTPVYNGILLWKSPFSLLRTLLMYVLHIIPSTHCKCTIGWYFKLNFKFYLHHNSSVVVKSPPLPPPSPRKTIFFLFLYISACSRDFTYM